MLQTDLLVELQNKAPSVVNGPGRRVLVTPRANVAVLGYFFGPEQNNQTSSLMADNSGCLGQFSLHPSFRTPANLDLPGKLGRSLSRLIYKRLGLK